MTTFSPEVRRLSALASNGYCQCSADCVEKATEFHHRVPNTKVNQQLYPIFLQSIFNCCHIAHGCHMTKPLPKMREADAAVYEIYLRQITKKEKAWKP